MNAPDSGLLERLLGMVRVARQGDGHCAFAAGDFCYRWQTEASFPAPVRIWSDGMGMDRGFAWLNGDQLHLVTTDSSELLLAEMLGWGEGLAKDFSGMTGLSVPADDSGSRLRRLLTEKGYEAAEPTLIQRSLPLQRVPAMPDEPAGYSFEVVDDSLRAEGWAAAYRRAFAPEMMDLETRRNVSRCPLYRQELDLVTCDASGQVVAFALVWFDELAGIGTFEPLGCIPEHRRKGLTRMLIIEGITRLLVLGARQAIVTTTGGRRPANLLYESLGFRTERVIRVWRRPRAGNGHS